MKHLDSIAHVTGRSRYLDDIPEQKGTLHAVVFGSPVAHGRITGADLTEAARLPGVVAIFSAADIPGENQIGGIIPDEPLLADGTVHFRGQPVFVIVAENDFTARQARSLIRFDYEPLPICTDVQEAFEKQSFLFPPRTFQLGDVDACWPDCAVVVEGEAATGAQEHLYLETQGAYAVPLENGAMKIYSSTQGPTLTQRIAGRVLDLPMHQIEVEVGRLGGAFGGKEDQATAWACLATLAAWRLQRPVKLVLQRHDDIYMTGKRHPYRSHFKIGLSKDLRILGYEVTFLQDGGAAADLSPAILERTLFHTTNAYFIPHVKATAYSCRTNVAPYTAFRGFGGPQALFVIEAAIAKAAFELGIPAWQIQEKNLLAEGDAFPYGQLAEKPHARACWDTVKTAYALPLREKEIAEFNRQSTWLKKGLAMMPICFGISFTKTPMNQAGALVHIYQDGSIGLNTGAVEMGQGVHTKLVQVAAKALSVAPHRIKMEPTDTNRVANTSPTAASSGADLNGKAVQHACAQLRQRLHEAAGKLLQADPDAIDIREEQVWLSGKPTDLRWAQLIAEAFLQRVNLSAQGYYATPHIHFDKSIEKGSPFAYHVYGAALITATVDVLRGRYELDSVEIVHDFGNSMNPALDQGQLEGGVAQGIGWLTLEEVRYNAEGRLLADSLSTYKVPDMGSAPKRIDYQMLQAEGPPLAILGSKATGEPPFLYGIGAYHALVNAMQAFRPGLQLDFEAPLTPERVLMALYPPEKEQS
ncbi:MAG: molybdopterin-dependent oxidoreductase [Saprospirales bacterium]|nr:molybdopterin-dependent oxidoreductase [Saprospirales bacterium]